MAQSLILRSYSLVEKIIDSFSKYLLSSSFVSGTVISSVEQKQYRYEPYLHEACNQVILIFSDSGLSNIPNSSHMKFFSFTIK